MHLPTGLKQAKFPEGEPSSEDIAAHFAALRKAKGGVAPQATGKHARDPRPLMHNEATAGWQAFSARKSAKNK